MKTADTRIVVDGDGDKEVTDVLYTLEDSERTSGQTVAETSSSESTTRKEPEALSGVKLWLLLASITLTYFIMLLDMSIIATASQRQDKAD